MAQVDVWAQRAALAERGVTERFLAKLWLLPGTRLARSGWPPTREQRLHRRWNYWWQAHLLDCLIDAQLRDPTPQRARLIARIARTVWLRNRLRWVNRYYDDIAWLGLALHRAGEVIGLNVRRPIAAITGRLRAGWSEHAGGGIWWRVGDDFKNTPANGPAAILLARVGDHEWARTDTEWLTERLVSPDSGVVWDGLRVRRHTGEVYEIAKQLYSYCQGVYIGACLEVSAADPTPEWTERAERTVAAVARRMAVGGVLRGYGGGDGGLFTGILTRYLALAARRLPEGDAAQTARELVLRSAQACWDNSAQVNGHPVFGAEWSRPAVVPAEGDPEAARDLSVQLSGWMLLEVAATL